MAKRFTDTDKWKDDWYLSLCNDYKIVWQWLLDNCDHCGICKPSITFLNIMCNTRLNEKELLDVMSGRVINYENKWFIPKFLKFQYSTLLSQKPAIISVVKVLIENKMQKLIPESFGNDYVIISESLDNHLKIIKKELNNDYQIIKDKDMVMVKDKNINKKIKAKNFSENFEFVFFDDGSDLKLTVNQKCLAMNGEYKIGEVTKFDFV